jgi:hypothetical protein
VRQLLASFRAGFNRMRELFLQAYSEAEIDVMLAHETLMTCGESYRLLKAT